MKVFKVRINIPSFYSEKDNEAQAAKVKEAEQQARDLMASMPTASKSNENYHRFEWLVGGDDMLSLMAKIPPARYGDQVSVEHVELIMDANDPMQALRPMLERLELASARLTADCCEGQPGFNNHANAPIPGPHLFGVSRLMLLEDCCTDHLQEMLDDGWRLVAACPQEARRPDYILGRAGEPGKQYRKAARE